MDTKAAEVEVGIEPPVITKERGLFRTGNGEAVIKEGELIVTISPDAALYALAYHISTSAKMPKLSDDARALDDECTERFYDVMDKLRESIGDMCYVNVFSKFGRPDVPYVQRRENTKRDIYIAKAR